MKLNSKRTILVGLAFLSISAFWQMYDSVMNLILTGTFHLNETLSGAIMAADNILALFLLPLFGGLSDRTHSKLGKRTPYILVGTAFAVILMNILPFLPPLRGRRTLVFILSSFPSLRKLEKGPGIGPASSGILCRLRSSRPQRGKKPP